MHNDKIKYISNEKRATEIITNVVTMCWYDLDTNKIKCIHESKITNFNDIDKI